MIVTHKLTIDLSRRGVTVNLDMVQGDGNTREVEITLTAAGVSWEPPAGTTAAVAFLKPDGTKGLYDKLPNGSTATSISGNTITAIMAPQVLTCAGVVLASVVFHDKSLDALATFPFQITVAKNPATGGQISNDYYAYSTLEEVNEAVEAAIASLEKAKEDFLYEAEKAQADFLAKAEDALAVVHGAATEDAPAIVCEATGQIVQMADASNRVLHGLTLYGKTTQNGTPTPDAPVALESVGADGSIGVTVCGKNLLKNTAVTQTLNGVTCKVNEDGSVIVSGTATASFTIVINASIKLQPGKYAISNGKSGVAIGVYTAKYQMLASTDWLASEVVSFTLNEATDVIILMSITSGTTYNTTAYPMIHERSATDATYEPYKEAQTLTTQTPNGLPGIPVTSGGNYTDENGQQWICDEVDFARGKYVQRCKTVVFDGSADETWRTGTILSGGIRFIVTVPDIKFTTSNSLKTETMICNAYMPVVANSSYTGDVTTGISGQNDMSAIVFSDARYMNTDLSAWLAVLAEAPVTVTYALATPIETDLSAEEMAQYHALHTNKPNTTVYNDAGAGMEVEYVADTKLYIDQKLAAISAALLNA